MCELKTITRNIALSVTLGLAVFFSWLQPLDTAATNQVDSGLKRALASYAVARTLNAVISVAQGTEVSVQIGVGATFAPGQALDPVNDLVEQFGDLMLAASVAFGIMHVLIKIGSFWFFSLMLTLSASVWLWMWWRNTSVPVWLTQFVIVFLFVRFSIPIVTIGSDFAFKQFLATDYSQSQNTIQISSNEISTLEKDLVDKSATDVASISSAKTQQPAEVSQQSIEQGAANPAISQAQEPPQNNGGLWNRLKNSTNEILDRVTAIPKALSKAKHGFETKLEKLKEAASLLVEHIVKIIVVFILQTIIIPIVLLWALYKVTLRGARSIGRERISTS